MKSLESIKIVGLHPFVANESLIQEAREEFWGSHLTDEEEAHVQGHFKHLYIIEIELTPANADFDRAAITQPQADLTSDHWQVPYLERKTDDTGARWAFFFHYLDRSKPLASVVGDLSLPEPTPIPPHLQAMEYWVP